MLTKISNSLEEAVDLLKRNEVVAFPTETVYGLGANALSAEAVAKIFEVKNRPADNPLIIHVSDLEMLCDLVGEIPPQYMPAITKYWPGPLTILLKKPEKVPNIVTAGNELIAVRMPSHPIAKKLIELCGFPLAAPSANTSGRPSPTTAAHVFHDLHGRLPLIIDGGSCQSGLESTVFDAIGHAPSILRPGGITYEQLSKLYDKVAVYKKDFSDKNLELAPTTPGMKYKHYSPDAKVILIEFNGNLEKQSDKIKEIYRKLSDQKVGVLLAGNPSKEYKIVFDMGSKPVDIAKSIFAGLRAMEDELVQVIIVQGVADHDEGLAIMNRLRKAATDIITP